MTILKKLAIAVAGTLGLLLVIGLLLPRTAHVERSRVVPAAPATVYTVLNGFHVFDRWSPWAGIDPNAQTTFEGPATGVGAKMSWSGNPEVGSGSQEILEAEPSRRIRLRLTFGDFPGDFTATHLLEPEGDGTLVTWAFDADYGGSIVGRYFGLLSERMLGPDYEKGLERLAAFVGQLPAGDFAALNITSVETSADPIVFLPIRAGNSVHAVGVALGVAYGQLSGYMTVQRLKQAGAPIAILRGKRNGTTELEAAIPVDRADITPPAPIRVGQLHAGRALKAEHRGAYAGLPAAHEQMQAYLVATGLTPDGPPWEQFVSDPARTAEADLVTHIYYPVR
jgi:effector-binding domain-containing protein